MSNIRISVIIPLFNKLGYIKRALDSVLAQTYQNFEVIVVNDGSTDGSEKVVEQYNDPRIRLINQENQGVSAARNRGIAEAKGDLIAFLDADDEWYDCHLRNIQQLAQLFPNAGVYGDAYEIILPLGRIIRPYWRHIPRDYNYVIIPDFFKVASDSETTPLNASNMAVPSWIISEVSGFPENFHVGEDMSFVTKIALRYQVAFSWVIGVKYRKDSILRVTNDKKLLIHKVRNSASIADYNYLHSIGILKRNDSSLAYIDKRLLSDAIRLIQILGERKYALRHLNLITTEKYRKQVLKWKFLALIPPWGFRIAMRLKQWISSSDKNCRCP